MAGYKKVDRTSLPISNQGAKPMKAIIEAPVNPGQLGIRWLGQNSFVFKTASGTLIGLDLYLSRTRPLENYVHPDPPISPEEIVVDYAFFTHDHWDHADPDTLVPLSKHAPKARFLGTSEGCAHMVEVGISSDRVTALQPGEEIRIDDFSVEATYSQRPSPSEGVTTHYGYLFRFEGLTLYNMGDSPLDMLNDPETFLRDVIEAKPDIATFPVIGDNRDRRPSDALVFARAIRPRVVIPCHYGCFKDRTIEPEEFTRLFSPDEEFEPLVLPYNEAVVYPIEHAHVHERIVLARPDSG
jgi:L-ascorbate metabolism protein UlaG (beta-lactamase superfamily)